MFFLSLPQPLHERLVQALSSNDNEKLIKTLKVVGNAGHPSSLKPIRKLFSGANEQLPLRVHIEAVLALRNIAKREPKLVRLHFRIPCITKNEWMD